jgi:hypothetical protein
MWQSHDADPSSFNAKPGRSYCRGGNEHADGNLKQDFTTLMGLFGGAFIQHFNVIKLWKGRESMKLRKWQDPEYGPCTILIAAEVIQRFLSEANSRVEVAPYDIVACTKVTEAEYAKAVKGSYKILSKWEYYCDLAGPAYIECSKASL